MTVENLILGNITVVVIFFVTVGYYKNKVDILVEDNKNLHNKFNASHRRLDTHGDDIVRLNTRSELAITAKEDDDKYLSKEMFRQFEKHIDNRFDDVQSGLDKILNFVQKGD